MIVYKNTTTLITSQTHLVIIELGHILLADSVDEERGGKGEEREKGSSTKDDGSIGMGRIGEQHWLACQADAGGGEGEALDQLDLGG